MSDRRPKFADLLVAEWVDDPLTKESGAGQYVHRYATADEKVAAVRRGVESGTIKGVEITPGNYRTDPATKRTIDRLDAMALNREPGTYIVIGPVSDGGSET